MERMSFTKLEQDLLLEIARASIRNGLDHGEPLLPSLSAMPDSLKPKRACFVTLERHGDLRGCIGSLEAREPLALAVARQAHNAAFEDPRFEPLQKSEFDDLDLHISVLSPMTPIDGVASEADLLKALRPGIDGLVLDDGRRYATFLPSVWEDLPDAKEFVAHLKAKGRWAPDEWPKGMKAMRYTSEMVGRDG